MSELEFDPLFTPGFHNITIEELEYYFATPFSDPAIRINLIKRFSLLVDKIKELGIEFELWIDGSFCTFKPNPGDVDLVTFFKEEDINSLSSEKKNILENIFLERYEIKYRYGCDIYWAFKSDNQFRSYWRGWFGFSRSEVPKGIPRLWN